MKKIFYITHDVYESQTLVAIGVSDKAIVKYLKKHKANMKYDDEFYRGIKCAGYGRTASRGSFTMIRMKNFKGTPRCMNTLTHEAFHLAEHLFNRMGIFHDWNTSGEAWAYFIGYTVEQVLENLTEE